MRNLAATYRPTKLDDVVGQEQAKAILTTHLASKPKSAYLFCGGAGTGKTTCARIFARSLNNSDFNIIEINAADNTGVDGVRKIITDASRVPIGTQYKIFVLDECHMLSNQAWNALLKLIEEPPDSVVFLFCTTDPHKIPGTILSRVLRVDFRRIDLNLIVKRLTWILEQEHASPIDEASLKYIAQLANGGMRDAISLLDKVLGYGVEVTPELINTALGLIGEDTSYQLLTYIMQNDVTSTLNMLDKLCSNSVDCRTWLLDFRRFVMKVLRVMLQTNLDQIALSAELIEKIQKLPKRVEYLRLVDVLSRICRDMVTESDPVTRLQIEFIKLAGDLKWYTPVKLN